MRFFSNGPNLPDSLLERRDQGRVVFLCGAGVSVNAELPNFLELTKHVFDFFDPPEESELAKAFKPWLEQGNQGSKAPLDQIFNLLYQEYGRNDVNTLVAERLETKVKKSEQSHHHKIISKISSDQNGKSQVVTTNFDLLFEQGVEPSPEIYEPPALPDINLGMPITGITYLHGRLLNPEEINHSYVLSSADFGRAYLSEGWATNFIRSLLKSYTVILVGYQAEDPPIKYLLQGLNHDERSDRSNLYAFDKGLPEEVEAKWRDRGVTAIAYNEHADLWATLEMWAERAESPRLWRAKVLELAMKGPKGLSPHERGMVAHVARTTPGARLFATAENVPPAEWICVFDAYCRVGSKSSGYGEDAETFDPYEAYGLDDDPPRPESRVKPIPMEHDHIIEWRRGDSNPPSIHKLSGFQFHGAVDMPPRLSHLANWLTKNLNSPVVAWWGLRQSGLNPRLVELIEDKLRRDDELHSEARHTWRLILEYQKDRRNFTWDRGWFDIKERVKVEGWTHSTLRHFENIMAPILQQKTVYGLGMSKPPLESWQQIVMGDIARWEIAFPEQHGDTLEIPDLALISVFAIKERQLHRATGLMEDIRTSYFENPTCYPEREVTGQSDNQSEEFFYSFLELFSRLIESFPDNARAYALNWSLEEKYYFKKLKLFSLNHKQVFTADEAISNLVSMNQKQFWDMGARRELLFLIHDRWSELSKQNRTAIVDRLLRGPENHGGWSDSDFPKVRDEIACRYVMWLKLNGCELENDHNTRLERMLKGIEDWSDD